MIAIYIYLFIIYVAIILYLKRKYLRIRTEILNYLSVHFKDDYKELSIMMPTSWYRLFGYRTLLDKRVFSRSKRLPSDAFLEKKYDELKFLGLVLIMMGVVGFALFVWYKLSAKQF